METEQQKSESRQALAQKILLEAQEETPQILNADQNEIREIISKSLELAQTFEKAAGPPHPPVHPDTDIVWAVSGPGAYSRNFPPYQDKDDRYKHLPWTRKMDRHRLRTGAALIYEITARRLGKKTGDVTSEDIKEFGPWLVYSGTPLENKHIQAVLEQPSVKIPKEKILMIGSFTDEDGKNRQIENTADQVKSLHFLKNTPPRRIAVVSHAPHLVRILYILEQFKDRIPQNMSVSPYPIKSPQGLQGEYSRMEIRGLLAYIYKYHAAQRISYPFSL